MARTIEKRLRIVLVECEFFFIPRGIIEINEIYRSVKEHFPKLCDDTFPCVHYESDFPQEEWKHIVRGVLQTVIKRNNNIKFTGNRGYWEFQ